MRNKNLHLFGYSGHALVVADCLGDEYTINAYYDIKENLENLLNLSYFGNENILKENQIKSEIYAFPSVGNNQLRRKLRDILKMTGFLETNAIHSSSFISPSVKIGLSTMVGPKAVINAYSTIGNGVIINTGAIIEHESKIGDFSHVAPGATIAGNVLVGENSFIGANSFVRENICIGKNVIIGAGSVVLKDIPDNEQWLGVPAKKQREIEK